MRITGRSESGVFADLGVLTAKPGYVHAIAYICHRDNLVAFQDEYTASDLGELYGPKGSNDERFYVYSFALDARTTS